MHLFDNVVFIIYIKLLTYFNIYTFINCVSFCGVFFSLKKSYCGAEKMFRKGGTAGYAFLDGIREFPQSCC